MRIKIVLTFIALFACISAQEQENGIPEKYLYENFYLDYKVGFQIIPGNQIITKFMDDLGIDPVRIAFFQGAEIGTFLGDKMKMGVSFRRSKGHKDSEFEDFAYKDTFSSEIQLNLATLTTRYYLLKKDKLKLPIGIGISYCWLTYFISEDPHTKGDSWVWSVYATRIRGFGGSINVGIDFNPAKWFSIGLESAVEYLRPNKVMFSEPLSATIPLQIENSDKDDFDFLSILIFLRIGVQF